MILLDTNVVSEPLRGTPHARVAGRVLAFDMACMHAYAALMAKTRSAGLAIGTADGYIAAIGAANGLVIATRDIRPFEAAGAAVINPWQT